MDHLSRSLNNSLVDIRLQRESEFRSDNDRLERIQLESTSRIALLLNGQSLFDTQSSSKPVWLIPAQLDIGTSEQLVFLGRHDDRAYFALDISEERAEEFKQYGDFKELRTMGSSLDDLDASILSYARGMCHWHQRHHYCGACGHKTQSDRAGHVRRCTNSNCGLQHFPRTDPAVIVLTYDGDHCLLGRKSDWSEGRYSTIAGFVEPGEAIEQAVLREVREETGVDVDDVVYHSSQPWPFPSSIMLGFHARAKSRDIQLIDGELLDAKWFSREDVGKAMQKTGPLRLPTRISIARRLVEDWYHNKFLNMDIGAVQQSVKQDDQITGSESKHGVLSHSISQAIEWLESQQYPEGYWMGRLESNACMEAEWLLAFYFLGIQHPKTDQIIKSILDRQREDGAWQVYFQSEVGDINTTVECYAALRAYGHSPESPSLYKARQWILSHGGLGATRVFTRYWLALIGEWPWEKTPNIPPEIIRFPLWFPFNIYHLACWARATMVPIAVLSSRRPIKPLPKDRRLDELFPEGRDRFDFSLPKKPSKRNIWPWLFDMADKILHKIQDFRISPGREDSTARCIEWIIHHQDADGAWGGIQPPWIYSVMALYNEGYSLNHPVLHKALSTLDGYWSYEKNGGRYIQACVSPVWDTLLTLLALGDCGKHPENMVGFANALDWVLDQQVLETGDWSIKLPNVEPGGWAFEFANRHYPDIDDTAVALIVLGQVPNRLKKENPRIGEALRRAQNWVLAMQSRNGGWGSFDKDNDKEILTKIPFSDFGETLDPPSVDVTAHVLEGLASSGLQSSHPSIQKALDFIRYEQEKDGSWFGRWGTNHIYGTSAVLTALFALKQDMSQSYITRAADWINAVQNPDGGWGESCTSYMDIHMRGRGDTTASQTAWAIMGLLAVDPKRYGSSIRRGVDYLIQHQHQGSWNEPQYTGTGFPGYGGGARTELERSDQAKTLVQGRELSRGFMINYNLYRHYFPLMALARAQKAFVD